MNVRLSLLSSLLAASALAASGAYAADIPAFEEAPVIEAPVPDLSTWTGVYLGLAVGGGAVNYDTTFFDIANIDGFGGEGWLVEGRLGGDIQFNRFVLGALVDVRHSDFETSASVDLSPFGGPNLGEVASLETGLGFDVMGRLGFLANDDALVYVLGGYSWQEFEGSFDLTAIGGPSDSDEDDADGWTVGAGVEARVTNHFSVFAEYRYTELDEFDFDTGTLTIGRTEIDILDIEPTFHTGRIGGNLKFNLFGG